MEFKAGVRPIDRDSDGDILKHVGVSRNVLCQLDLGGLIFGVVQGIADRAVFAAGDLVELKQSAFTVDDDMADLALGCCRFMCLLRQGAGAVGAEHGLLDDDSGGIGIDGVEIGLVDLGQGQGFTTAPNRDRQGIEHSAQAIALTLGDGLTQCRVRAAGRLGSDIADPKHIEGAPRARQPSISSALPPSWVVKVNEKGSPRWRRPWPSFSSKAESVAENKPRKRTKAEPPEAAGNIAASQPDTLSGPSADQAM